MLFNSNNATYTMHYILLAIVLNLGKEKLDVMKLSDMRKYAQIVKSNHLKKNTDSLKDQILDKDEMVNLPDSNENTDLFLNNSNIIEEPYIPSNDFAVLLSEDEQGNIIQNDEEAPKFLENIKNKLINSAENNNTVIGSQIEGPSFFENIKNKILNKEKEKNAIIISEDIGPKILKENLKKEEETMMELSKKTINKDNEKTKDKTKDKTDILGKIKNKTTKATNTIKNINIKDISKIEFIDNLKKKIIESNDTPEEKLEQLKIVGTLFESEIDQALKTESNLTMNENIFESDLKNIKEIKYEENEDYSEFLKNKEIEALVKSEKIIIPNIKPRPKEISTYKTQEIPEELLEARSFQNRHIPKILQKKEEEEILRKTIEYGMLPEFKAFMNDFRDANLVLSNQHTLLTYATKYRQYNIIRYLIHIGANVNKRDDRLDTPLIIAVRNNDLEAVRILINSNADPNMLDILKRTPLIYSIEKNYTPIAIYLIDNGADINISNGIGEGTLAMSIRLGRNVIKEKIIGIIKEKNGK